jgi:tetratricopeptide (TPR) repeat protein
VRRLQGEWRRGHRSVQVADTMGWALYKAGRAKDALPFARLATDQGLRSALFSYHLGEIERALGDLGPARRHLDEALRTNPNFSPLLAPSAREARDALGEPAAGGPSDVVGDGPSPIDPPSASPSPSPSSSPSAPASVSASPSAAASAAPSPSVPSGSGGAAASPAAAPPAPALRPVQRSATAASPAATTG